MTNEELYLRNKLRNRNPFIVPDGYFDTFAQQLMAELPQKQVARQRSLRPWLYAAACACVAIFSITLYFSQVDDHQASAVVLSSASESSYVDQAFDYALIDNQDIYACLTSE